jgi:carboxypeptidase C (cathepsin A)
MALNPRLKVLVAAGMYDGFLPCAMGAETERQLPSNLRPAFSFHCYAGGHSMYLDPSVRRELSRDVMQFTRGTSPAERNER